MNIRWSLAAAALAFTVAVSASAQGSTAVKSVCKDGTNDATVGRGACSRHGGVDKTATAKAQTAADKTAKAAKTASKAAPNTAGSTTTVTCKDGSTSQAGRGACAHHGGVAPGGKTTTATAKTPTPPPASSTSAKNAPTASTSKVGNGSSDKTNPTGAIAQCKDGTYSHAKHRTGACGHHGGVAKWM